MPASFAEFLTIGTVGIFMGYFQSYIVELWPAWKNLAPQYKRLIMMVLAVGLSLGVQAINVYVPESVITDLNPWYVAIAAGIQLVSAEITHKQINAPKGL